MQNLVFTQLSISELRELIREEAANALESFQTANTAEKTTYDFEEGCKYLGISTSHGYKLTSAGKIGHYKPGKKIYFHKADLDNFMQESRVKTVGEMAAETMQAMKKSRGSK